MSDLIDREQALACFWNYANNDGTGYDETDMPAYDRLQALPIVAEVEDCISRQDAIEWVENILEVDKYYHPHAKSRNVPIDEVIDRLKRVPSAQPEIIRCRDCKHMQKDEIFHQYWCNGNEVRLDHFCGYAERRQDE